MALVLDNVSFSYPNSNCNILNNITLTINPGTILAIMGPSGSGKSTLLRLLNGLYRPNCGTVKFNGDDIWQKGYNLRDLRRKVGLVFQNPRDQLFASTVLEDVSFGPKNQGLSLEEATYRSEEALMALSIEKKLWHKSPFSLSGGEKRRVALAGILALKSDYLVLDEIASYLDGRNKDEIFSLLKKLNNDGVTIIYTTHSKEDVALFSKESILLENGKIRRKGELWDIYHEDRSYMPEAVKFKEELSSRGIVLDGECHRVNELASSIYSFFSQGKE